ncbi:MAG: exonuclease domain-containing protein [Lachnospiraceae bacterium]|nr:exonuclease domain-containing protein [Lachnospiraceae bacterium]
MNYIVFDLEWNQAGDKYNKDYGLPFEIIEIGAVKLNRWFKVVDKFEVVIKPQIYHYIHFMTNKIVHLSAKELENGKPFTQAMQDFLNWCGNDYIFCIFGTSDITELQRNMMYYGMDMLSNGPLKYYDVQKLFSLAYEDGKIRRSLEYAVDYLNIDKTLPFHRAYDDAYYTARVFKKVNRFRPRIKRYFSYDVYITPPSKEDEIYANFKTYSKYISREFPDKNAAIDDEEVTSTRCYLCGKEAPVHINWFSVNGKHYYSMAFCKKHGYLKGKIRLKKTDYDTVYVVKTLKLVPKEIALEIAEKQEKIRQQRLEKRRARKERS